MNRRSVSNRAHSLALLKRLVVLPLFIVSLSASPDSSRGSTENPSLSFRAASAIQTARNLRSGAVVRIRGSDSRGELYGSGFFVDPTGTICTTADLVKGLESIVIVKDGKEYPCHILALDEGCGVAFLKLSGEMPHAGENFLPPHATPTPSPFSPAVALGYSKEEEHSLSVGMIAGTRSHEGDSYFRIPQIIAKIPLAEGEAGAPVFDLDGHLLGMVLAGKTDSDDCRILPVGAIEKLHTDLLRFGQLNPGWVGAVVEEAAVPEGNSITRISSVEPGSPAESAGVRSGDMVLTFGNRQIMQPDQLLEASFYLTSGECVPMTISRGGKIRHIEIHCIAPPVGNIHTSSP